MRQMASGKVGGSGCKGGWVGRVLGIRETMVTSNPFVSVDSFGFEAPPDQDHTFSN